MKRLAFAGLALVALATSCPAFAEPTKEECIEAYRKNQPLRRDGRFREAIEQLLVCARDPCPEVLQSDCVAWLDEARARMPSVIFKARSGATTDITDVRVVMDGVELQPRLDGRAIEVDAGEHTFFFDHPGSPLVEKKILVVEGEKGRIIEVDLAPKSSSGALASEPPATTAAEHTRPVPWTVYALGGLGLAGLGVGTAFGAIGVGARADLYDCKPGCSREAIDDVSSKLLVADVALAIGVVSLAAATILYLTRPPASRAGRAAVLEGLTGGRP